MQPPSRASAHAATRALRTVEKSGTSSWICADLRCETQVRARTPENRHRPEGRQHDRTTQGAQHLRYSSGCPNGHPIALDDRFCPICGARPAGRCANGHVVAQGQQYCRICGAAVLVPGQLPPPGGAPDEESSKNTWLIVVVVVVRCWSSAASSQLVLSSNSPKSTTTTTTASSEPRTTTTSAPATTTTAPATTTTAATVIVPNVYGQTAAAAQATLASVRLVGQTGPTTTCTGSEVAGTVVRTSPTPGVSVAPGSTVTLTACTAP